MFKNLTIFKFHNLPGLQELEQAFAQSQFAECGATQEKSTGWIPPRGNPFDPLVESVSGHWIAKFCIETRKVPSDILEKRVNEAAARIEEAEGRKPGKKERREIKDNMVLELLPLAFPKRKAVPVWFDISRQIIAIGTTSYSVADECLNLLCKLDGLRFKTVSTKVSPVLGMTEWLVSEPYPDFSVDRELTLKSTDENKSTVKYKNHPLDIDEVRMHINAGKVPTSMAMTFKGRVSFKLSDQLKLSSITVLDAVFTSKESEGDDAFDGDVVIMTAELGTLIDGLVESLDGYLGAV